MKRTLSLILTAALTLSSLLSLFSCAGAHSGDEYRASENRTNITDDYCIVLPAEATNKERTAAADLKAYLLAAAGVDLPLVTDDVGAGDYEIIIGAADRPESESASQALGEGIYIVEASGHKLAVYAANDNNYKYALAYLKYGLVQNGSASFASDLSYVGNEYTAFAADELINGKMSVTVSITPYSEKCRTGLFVGKPKDGTLFGYSGYCVLLENDSIVMYEMDKELTVMAERKCEALAAGRQTDLMLVVNQTSIGAYILDDAEGYDPWPEIELKTSRTSGSSAGFVELSGYGALYTDLSITEAGAAAAGAKYTNSIYAGYADPDVILYEGNYYLYGTSSNGFKVHSSPDLVNWKDCGKCVEPTLWGKTEGYWAPDVEYIDGKFYMAVTCDLCVGIAVSDSPLGPFKEHSQKVLFTNACDGNIFVDDNGGIFLYYVTGMGSVNYGIYGVRLDKNMNPVTAGKLLLKADADWEKDSGTVTEGPFVIKHNGVYYLTYSGSHYKSIYYAVGYACADSPLGKYTKYEYNPILVGNSQIHGTGHHSIITTAGGEMFIVYHCHNSLTEVQTRKICIDRIRFSPAEGDIDRLEVYGPTVTGQPYPDAGK